MKMKQLLLAGAVVCAIAATGCASGNTANNAAKLRNQERARDTVNRTVTNARRALATHTPAPVATAAPQAYHNVPPQTYINAPQSYAVPQTNAGVVTDRTREAAHNTAQYATQYAAPYTGMQYDYNNTSFYNQDNLEANRAMMIENTERYHNTRTSTANNAVTPNTATNTVNRTTNNAVTPNTATNTVNRTTNNAVTPNTATNTVNRTANNAVTPKTATNTVNRTANNTVTPNTATNTVNRTANNAATPSVNNPTAASWTNPSPYAITAAPYTVGSGTGTAFTGTNYTGVNSTGMNNTGTGYMGTTGGALIY